MAENISTGKALGGGDFTSCAAWIAWAEVSGQLGETLECYDDGGSLGAFSSTVAWAAGNHDASNKPRIIAAAGHGHGGSTTSGAACGVIDNSYQDYFEVIGMRTGGIRIKSQTLGSEKLTSNLISDNIITSIDTARPLLVRANAWDVSPHQISSLVVENNIILTGTQISDTLVYYYAYGRLGRACWITGTVRNNLFLGSGVETHNTRFRTTWGGDWYYPWMNITFENNMIFGASSLDIQVWENNVNATVTMAPSNCITGDGTADDHGGSNNQVNKTIAECIQDWGNSNFNLVQNGPAHESGITNDVTTDMVGVERPQGTFFDIGPLELLALSDVATTLSMPVELLSSLIADANMPVELTQPDRVFHGTTKRVWTVADNGSSWALSSRGKTWTIPKRVN